MATKKKNKTKNKNILPYILLPVSMLVSGLIKVTIEFIPNLINIIEGNFMIADNTFFGGICAVVATIATIVIIVLCSLCCKGLTKKLQFIASACAGSLVYIFTNDIKVFVFLALEEIDYDVAVIVAYIVNVLVVCICFALAVVVAELFFKKLSSYEEAPAMEGKKSFDIKKMILPIVLIVAAAILQFGLAIFYDFSIHFNMNDGSFIGYIINIVWNFGVNLLLVGILFGSMFILKDKYKTLTCVASACAGYTFTLWGIPSIIVNAFWRELDIITSSITIKNTNYWWYIPLGIVSIASAIFGVVFYILLNRKEMKKIDKTEN